MVSELFEARGWTSIATDDLVGLVLGFTSLMIGIISGFVGMALERLTTYDFTESSFGDMSYLFGSLKYPYLWAFGYARVYMDSFDFELRMMGKSNLSLQNLPLHDFTIRIGFLTGLWVGGVMVNVVLGSVNTLVVCWAESPSKLQQNHPEAARDMTLAWNKAFPDAGIYLGSELSSSELQPEYFPPPIPVEFS